MAEIDVNPSGACADAASSSTGRYTIETSPDGTTWTTASSGRFGRANRSTYLPVTLSGRTAGVQYVRYTMLSSQVRESGGHCPGAATRGCLRIPGEVALHLAVLGDSIGFGQGATSPADTVGARLAEELRAAGAEPELRVFAVPGATSANLARQSALAIAWEPDIAVIVIGANDVTQFVPARDAADWLTAAVQQLRAAGAEVVVAPAPDLSVVPWVPVPMRAAVRAASATLRAAQTRAALAAGARVADVNEATAARFAADPSLFCADRFHPSSAGYAVIAAGLAPSVLAAASLPPTAGTTQ